MNRRSFGRLGFTVAVWTCLLALIWTSIDKLPSFAEVQVILVQSETSPQVLLAPAIFFLLAMLLRAFRFHYLLSNHIQLRRQETFCIFLWTFFIGAISPLRTGEGLRIIWLKNKKIGVKSVTLLWFVERLMDLILLLGITAISAMHAYGFIDDKTLAGLFVVGAAAFVFLLNLIEHQKCTRLGDAFRKIAPLLNANIDGPLVKSYATLGLLTIGIWVMMAAMFYLLYGIFLQDFHWSMVGFLLGAVNLSFLIVLLPGNVVGYQLAAVFALSMYNAPISQSLAASIVAQVMTFVLLGVIAFVARAFLASKRTRGVLS